MSTLTRGPPPPRRALPPPPKLISSEEQINVPYLRQASEYPPPPPVPPRGGARTPITPVLSRSADYGLSLDELSRLLARKPPPPPSVPAVDLIPTWQERAPIPPPRSFISARSVPITPPPQHLSSKPVLIVQDIPPPPPVQDPSCLHCRDFSQADAHAALFPRNSVSSLQDLALSLTEPFEDDVDKARVIFTWLHCNISYDAHAFLSNNIKNMTPEETLASGLAVCEGYAGLFEKLGDFVELQVHKVTGHGKGYGYQPLGEGEPAPEMTSNHAWNCILLNDQWHLVDPCWGAGVLNGTVYEPKFSPNWFISSPVEFGQRHFPSDPSFQLTDEESTWEEYILAPDGPTLTAVFHDCGLSPILVQPPTKCVPERQFIKFSVSKRCSHMSCAESDNYILVISSNGKDFFPLTFNDEECAWTTTFFTPRDGDVTLYTVDTVSNQGAKGLGQAGYNKAKGRKAMGFKGLAIWSVVHL